MKKYFILILIAISILIIGCADNNNPNENNDNLNLPYLPDLPFLIVGNQWEYEVIIYDSCNNIIDYTDYLLTIEGVLISEYNSNSYIFYMDYDTTGTYDTYRPIYDVNEDYIICRISPFYDGFVLLRNYKIGDVLDPGGFERYEIISINTPFETPAGTFSCVVIECYNKFKHYYSPIYGYVGSEGNFNNNSRKIITKLKSKNF